MNRRPVRVAAAAAIVIGMVASGCTGDENSDTAASSVDPTQITPSPTNQPTDRGSESPALGEPPTTTTITTTPSTDRGSASPGLGEPPARLDVALDAAEIAARLSAAHSTMIDPASPGDERAAAGVDYQLVLRYLADRPDLDDDVLGALDPASRPTIERIIRARQFLQQRNAARPPQSLPDELPAWTIVEPEPIDTLLAHYAEAERRTGIAWYWLAAVHLQETRMGRIQGVSSADAVGPMQFLPETWARCCVGDPTATPDAIVGAATFLAQHGGPDDMAAALYEYNPNESYVTAVTAYAENLRDEPELYPGYHAFQVFFGTSTATVRLPIGYSTPIPIDPSEHLDANPQDAA